MDAFLFLAATPAGLEYLSQNTHCRPHQKALSLSQPHSLRWAPDQAIQDPSL